MSIFILAAVLNKDCRSLRGFVVFEVKGAKQERLLILTVRPFGLLIIPVSSKCFGKLFCPSSGALDFVLQLVV